MSELKLKICHRGRVWNSFISAQMWQKALKEGNKIKKQHPSPFTTKPHWFQIYWAREQFKKHLAHWGDITELEHQRSQSESAPGRAPTEVGHDAMCLNRYSLKGKQTHCTHLLILKPEWKWEIYLSFPCIRPRVHKHWSVYDGQRGASWSYDAKERKDLNFEQTVLQIKVRKEKRKVKIV